MADKNIKITVRDRRAIVEGSPVIVCGNSGYTVTFTFDDEWDLTSVRTARFVYVKDGIVQHEDKVFSGNVVAVPILSNVAFVKVGVFAGDLCTTTPARINCELSILCGSGKIEEPTPDVYNQIMEEFNNTVEYVDSRLNSQDQAISDYHAEWSEVVENTREEMVNEVEQIIKDASLGDARTLGGKTEGELSVADSAKLGGKGASEYALSKNYESGGNYVLMQTDKDQMVDNKMYRLILSNNALYLYMSEDGGTSWKNQRLVATTADLANYLPLSGGEVNGNLKLALNGVGSIYSNIMNDLRNVYQEIDGAGSYWLYDATNGKSIINSLADGTNTFNGTATGNLPLTGGVVDGSVQVNGTDTATPLRVNGMAYDNISYAKFFAKGSALGSLGFYGVDKPVLQKVNGTSYNLLHTGNVGDYALPKSGGRIESSATIPFEISTIGAKYEESYHRYYANGKELGGFGYYGEKNPVVLLGTSARSLHHDGNSAKVVVSETPLTAEGAIRVW